MHIRTVNFPSDYEELSRLILDYATWLNIDLSYQNFEEEMKRLDTLFTLPNGIYTFAISKEQIAGGVGFRRMDDNTAEIKRLYVREKFQGLHLGQKLMDNILHIIKEKGYKKVVLDAVPPTVHAQKLYRKMGFYEIPAYFDNPTPNTKFFEYTFE